MDRTSFGCLPPLHRLPWLTFGLCVAGLSLTGLAWSQAGQGKPTPSAPNTPYSPMRHASLPTHLPPAAPQVVSVDLDTLLQMVDEQNPQIVLARVRVREACAEKALADKRWLAVAKQVEADAKIWQQKVELARTRHENLLDAIVTYTDLLTARTAESICHEILTQEEDLLKQAKDLAQAEPGTMVQVETIEGAVNHLRQLIEELRQKEEAASAKLSYLAGMDPQEKLTTARGRLTAVYLVDVTVPTAELVARALATGPGIQETQGLLATVQEGVCRIGNCGQHIPCIADRARARKCIASIKLEEVQLSYRNLQSKLTLGVQEAREASISGQQAVYLSEKQVRHANEAYRLSYQRFKQAVPGSGTSEVLQYLQLREQAFLNYLKVLSAYDKAQFRLLLLLNEETKCVPQPVPTTLPSFKETPNQGVHPQKTTSSKTSATKTAPNALAQDPSLQAWQQIYGQHP